MYHWFTSFLRVVLAAAVPRCVCVCVCVCVPQKDLVGAARQLTSKVEEQEEGNTLFKFSKDAADDFTVWGYAGAP